MFGKFIKKINDFIQWTKNWHVFHIIPFLFCYVILDDIVRAFFRLQNIELLKFITMAPYNHIMTFDFSLLISTIISTAIMSLKYLISKDIHVEKQFLLNNSKYNKFYISFYLYILIAFIYIHNAGKFVRPYLEKDDLFMLGLWLLNCETFYSSIYFIILIALLIRFMKKRKEKLKRTGQLQFSLIQNIYNIIIFSIYVFLTSLPILLVIYV